MAKKVRRLGRGLSALISDLEKPAKAENSNDEENGDDREAGIGLGPNVQREITVLRKDVGDSESVVALNHGGREVAEEDGSVTAMALSRTRETAKSHDAGVKTRTVAVDALRPNRHQPRGAVDDKSVMKLARSIASSGILQPIVARDTEEGLEIIAGERRWRAAQVAGLATVPVLIRDATDEQMLELAMVENIHREDLNAVDRALAYRRYCDVFELTVEQVASKLGEDRTTVTNYVRLLELPEEVRVLLAGKCISMGHARALLGLESGARQIELATLVAGKELSVRVLEDLVRRERPVRVVTSRRRRGESGPPDAHIRELEDKFESELKTKVKIHVGPGKGAGRIVIEFFSLDGFDRIAERMGVDVGKGDREKE